MQRDKRDCDMLSEVLPVCCGKRMSLRAETAKFLEVLCGLCGDTVFIKKANTEAPQLLDD